VRQLAFVGLDIRHQSFYARSRHHASQLS